MTTDIFANGKYSEIFIKNGPALRFKRARAGEVLNQMAALERMTVNPSTYRPTDEEWEDIRTYLAEHLTSFGTYSLPDDFDPENDRLQEAAKPEGWEPVELTPSEIDETWTPAQIIIVWSLFTTAQQVSETTKKK